MSYQFNNSTGSGGAGGISTINGSSASAQTIAGSSPLKVASSAGTTTLSGPFTSFIFQPGGTATAPGSNVYTSFSALYTDFNKCPTAAREIVFDGQFNSSVCNIPTGTFDFSGARFSTRTFGTVISVDNGSIWVGQFPRIDFCDIRSQSATTVYTVTTGPCVVILDNVANIQADNIAPFVKVDNTLGGITFSVTILKTGSSVNYGGSAAFSFINVTNAFIYAEEQGSFAANTLAADVTSSIIGVIPVGSGTVSLTQPAVIGVLAIDLSSLASNHAYDDTGTNLSASTVQTAIVSLAERVAPININVTPVSNASTTETDLMSYSFSGNNMMAAGDSIRMKAGGTLAATVSSKTIKGYYGTTAFLTSGSLAVNGGSWVMDVEIVRVSNGHQIVTATLSITSAALVTTTIVKVSDPAGGNGDTIKVTGTDSLASSGVTQSLMDTRFTPII